MFTNEELLRWAGRLCLLLVAALGMMGYHYANIRFVPVMAGFAILAAVCYVPRPAATGAKSLRHSGQHPAI
jgi:hypothetical protein